MSDLPTISWVEAGETRSAVWQSEAGVLPHKRVVVADDTITADAAYRLACEGTALLWRGDFQNARQLLQAMARRVDSKSKAKKPKSAAQQPASQQATPAEAFHLHRQAQSQRARTLGMLLVPVNADYSIPLKRSPEVHQAFSEVYGERIEGFIISLRELLGLIGAHEWRKNGVEIPALANRIHPYYGVFSPVRGEYINLVANAPLPSTTLAFDIGTGSGILAAVLAKRGVHHIIATDQDPRALACAQDNLDRLSYANQVELLKTDLFPPGRAPLIVCNPPWLPARPSSPIEHAIYDQDSLMLLGFINGLAEHLTPDGEGWLILSDFAEHLGLRSREELLGAIAKAGLRVLGKIDVKPQHPKVSDSSDALHNARSKELTSLWRLALVDQTQS
ncbi:MAG TPA: class I SAM-dependent methyltransferase [Methylophilaceae bacterium]|nr:class I SAM-dependent methyltransferase [Methylophilaceae bacterium]